MLWASIFRMGWWFGYSTNAESFKKAKERAACSALKLSDIASEYDSVVFIGHGLLNQYIAKELLSHAWQGPVNPGRKFWDFAVYEKIIG